MSKKIAIVTDTSSDLPVSLAEKYNITVVDAYVHFGTDTYRNRDMTLKEFYDKIDVVPDEKFPKTSQASSHDFITAYEKLKNEGYSQILSIHVSNSLSGTINSANIAAGMTEGTEIEVVDVHSVSFGVTVCVLKALEMINEGKTTQEIIPKIQEIGQSLKLFVLPKTLKNLLRSGRMSKVRFRFAKILNIKPIIIAHDGKIFAGSKARGLSKAKDKLFSMANSELKRGKKIKYIIAHADNVEEAKEWEKQFLKNHRNAEGFISEIGMVIGTHVGRGAILLLPYQE